jgi:hypothetical protein
MLCIAVITLLEQVARSSSLARFHLLTSNHVTEVRKRTEQEFKYNQLLSINKTGQYNKTMATPPINVTPASPDTNATGITNRRLSYQPADTGPTHRSRSSVQYGVGGQPVGAGSSPYAPSHLRTGSVPYVPDAPTR